MLCHQTSLRESHVGLCVCVYMHEHVWVCVACVRSCDTQHHNLLAHMFSNSDNQMLLHFSTSKTKPAWPPGGRGSSCIPIPCLPLRVR
jgi:hypothetical protein